jgi:hypothetical protein
MRSSSNHRRALTILEALILLVLFVILLGVFVTFLQKSREASNRVHCAEKLKQIGEAIYHFHGQVAPHILREDPKAGPKGIGYPHLPAARIADGYATWAVQLSPYLHGKHPLADWDIGRPYYAQPEAVRSAFLPGFLCPSRNRDTLISISGDASPGGKHHTGAVGDYACAAGTGDPADAWTTSEANGAIILGKVIEQKDERILAWVGRTSFSSLKRGRSYTILVGEKHVPPEGFGQAAFGDGSHYNGDHPASFSRIGGPGFAIAPSPTAPFNKNFGSYHPGLCQFLMADCSVRPMNNATSEEILGRLVNRHE